MNPTTMCSSGSNFFPQTGIIYPQFAMAETRSLSTLPDSVVKLDGAKCLRKFWGPAFGRLPSKPQGGDFPLSENNSARWTALPTKNETRCELGPPDKFGRLGGRPSLNFSESKVVG